MSKNEQSPEVLINPDFSAPTTEESVKDWLKSINDAIKSKREKK